MTRRLVDIMEIGTELGEVKRAQALVWSGIRTAAHLIEAANPQAIIDAIENEAQPGILGSGWSDPDPKVHADLQRKKQVLEAAAAFQREWARLRDEALATTQEGQTDEEDEKTGQD